MEVKDKKQILIVDDSEMNRAILADILEDEFEIIEAEDGQAAIMILQKNHIDISLMLLDIVMPEMDGFEVLEIMNQNNWVEEVPVVMISAESSPSAIEKAYELGATDFISRPFDSSIVYRRVNNTLMLYEKQNKLVSMVAEQIYENEKRSNLLIAILSHIVEFRNGESGLHVLHVQSLTELLLRSLVKKTDRYNLTLSQISLISVTSALHDIGKIGIPDNVLNKPGRLTDEEFEIMKTHSELGARMLKEIPFYKDEELMTIAIDICQSHHERYDGKGYPNSLKGDEIPIAAQVVSLADVYDALTSERVYKKAFSHDKAVSMILNGECGTFNPLLLECLKDSEDSIRKVIENSTQDYNKKKDIEKITETFDNYEELSTFESVLESLKYERNKNEFYAAMSKEIQFEYTAFPSMLSVSGRGAKELGIEENILNPFDDAKLIECFGRENINNFMETLDKTTAEHPVVQLEFEMIRDGQRRWKRVIAQTIWDYDQSPKFIKFYGKITDIHDEHIELANLKVMSSQDGLTGIYNRVAAEKLIAEKTKMNPDHRFAFIMLDVDNFKLANDKFGHIFGDSVLKYIADTLMQSIRSDDIAARIGGDEFMLFMDYKYNLDMIIDRVFNALNGAYEEFPVSVSMGIAKSEDVGTDFNTLKYCADCALYASKKNGKGCYHFYDDSMKAVLADSLKERDEQQEERK